jgi:hypothetical protein
VFKKRFGFPTPPWDWAERATDALGRMLFAATRASSAIEVGAALLQVRKRISFAPFDAENVHFTKTGSGQTWGKNTQNRDIRFLTGGWGATAGADSCFVQEGC